MIIFFLLSSLCLLCAILLITNKNPVYSVLSLVLLFVCGSILLLILGVDFLPFVFLLVCLTTFSVFFLVCGNKTQNLQAMFVNFGFYLLSKLPFINLIHLLGVVIILLSGDIIPWLLDFFFNSSPAICVGDGENLPVVDIANPIGGENPHPAPLVLPENIPIIDAPVTPENGSPVEEILMESPVTPENGAPMELPVTPEDENGVPVNLFVTPEDPSPRPRVYSWGFTPIPSRTQD